MAELVQYTKAHNRLQELCLTEEVLIKAVEAGERERLKYQNTNHPRITQGFMGWSETLAVLRDELIGEGWLKEEKGLPVVFCPKSKVSIAVASGDYRTGISGVAPQLSNAKGGATLAMVESNSYQLSFDTEVLGVKKHESTSSLTWYLLVHRTTEEIRFELSLPMGLSKSGKVSEWEERILFSPISLSSNFDIEETLDDQDNIVVEVVSKI